LYLGLRVEWAKSRARAARWAEEVQLLGEEMRRILFYLQWKSEWWLAKTSARSGINKELSEGLSAYAAKQHAILQQMGRQFAAEWWPIVSANNLDTKWPAHFIPDANSQLAPMPVVLDPSSADFDGLDDFDDFD
jgi:hypothetical protein